MAAVGEVVTHKAILTGWIYVQPAKYYVVAVADGAADLREVGIDGRIKEGTITVPVGELIPYPEMGKIRNGMSITCKSLNTPA